MMVRLASITRMDDHGVVRRPMPGDALGAALRGVYGKTSLPDDMLRLLRRLDGHPHGH